MAQRSANLSAQLDEGIGKLNQELKDKRGLNQTSLKDEQGQMKVEPELQE